MANTKRTFTTTLPDGRAEVTTSSSREYHFAAAVLHKDHWSVWHWASKRESLVRSLAADEARARAAGVEFVAKILPVTQAA